MARLRPSVWLLALSASLEIVCRRRRVVSKCEQKCSEREEGKRESNHRRNEPKDDALSDADGPPPTRTMPRQTPGAKHGTTTKSARVAWAPSPSSSSWMVVLPALALFWAALYALRARRRRRAPASFLPAPSASAPSVSPVLFSSRGTRITLHNFHLSAQLFSFNDIHLSASARLRKSRWKSLLTLVYDAGCLLGVLGMVGSLLLLVWASFQLALSLYDQSHPIPPPHSSALHKRDTLSEAAPSVSTSPHHSPLTLIVSSHLGGPWQTVQRFTHSRSLASPPH